MAGEAPELAPDGSRVRRLVSGAHGSMARFELAAGETSTAVVHRSVEEFWYVLSGEGEMWLANAGDHRLVALAEGVCLRIAPATRFQFRCSGPERLTVLGVTMPPWPGDGEARIVEGPWPPSVGEGVD